VTLVMLAADIAARTGKLSDEMRISLVAALRRLPAQAQRAIELASVTEAMALRYAGAAGFMYIGRAFGYPAALEGALKIKEISYLHAEGYAAGELKHGPISLLDATVPLVAVATRSATYEKLISNLMEGKARDARVIAIATEGDTEIEHMATDVCFVPETLEPLSTILAVIPLQLFAYHVAVAQGRDVDQPRNLAKSVTVE
jgi:glucosamine--fructose-6-phosphate aminotransferase (isomerizing)